MKDKLLIIGASGHGKVVADIAMKMNKWKNIAFLDDDRSLKESLGIPVIGSSADVIEYKDEYDVFVAIGNNATRERIQNNLETMRISIPTIIHPVTTIGTEVALGAGTVIMAGVIINCCTQIGKGCIINTGATLDHDNMIGDFVHISPGAHLAGAVKVGIASWIGAGSVVINNTIITDGCKIGAGAVVVKNISEVGTYVGVPARRVRV